MTNVFLLTPLLRSNASRTKFFGSFLIFYKTKKNIGKSTLKWPGDLTKHVSSNPIESYSSVKAIMVPINHPSLIKKMSCKWIDVIFRLLVGPISLIPTILTFSILTPLYLDFHNTAKFLHVSPSFKPFIAFIPLPGLTSKTPSEWFTYTYEIIFSNTNWYFFTTLLFVVNQNSVWNALK